MEINWNNVEKLIQLSFDEDFGKTGDITTKSIIPKDSISIGTFLAKDGGIVAGTEVVKKCFQLFDEEADAQVLIKDGTRVVMGDEIIKVSGKTRSLLGVERTALNFLCHLSGITTFASEVVSKVKDYPARILDTRKTTPGMRQLEKYAASLGGVLNHRIGLYDGVLVKDNHIKEAGGIEKAVAKLKEDYPGAKIEVEVENFDELRKAASAGADVIMLDNVKPRLMRKAAKMTLGMVELEVSGGVRIEDVEKIAATGVHYISLGQVTTNAPNLDISFLIP